MRSKTRTIGLKGMSVHETKTSNQTQLQVPIIVIACQALSLIFCNFILSILYSMPSLNVQYTGSQGHGVRTKDFFICETLRGQRRVYTYLRDRV
jgi:hypothetical protein